MPSTRTSQVKNDNALAGKIEKIIHNLEDSKHNLDDLKISIPNHLVKDVEEFAHRIDGLVDDINRAKKHVPQEKKKEGDSPRTPIRLKGVFNRVKEEIIADGKAMKPFEVSYGHLDKPEKKLCFLFLSIFPKNAVIVRRPLIYWWIGEGLIKSEEEGEKMFEYLLKHNLIIANGNGKNPHVNKCQIHPWIRYMLISLAKKANFFAFDSRGTLRSNINSAVIPQRAFLFETKPLSLGNEKYDKSLRSIFNIDEENISIGSNLPNELEKLVVLQLGRWHDFQRHHIEIISVEAILRKSVAPKHLKYLSLRGVSVIASLPSSITDLISLEILDLRACNNLEKLPYDISSLRKLTHFDVSECYFLESMPKRLDKLTSLQVLKGYIIGSLSQLINLKSLKRLSLYMGKEDMEQGQLKRLRVLSSIRSLKISWIGISKGEKKPIVKQTLSFPLSLKKLKLENVPQEKLEWLSPQTLPNLKKLYILGGKLSSLDHSKTEQWKVEILHLMYLKNLKIGLQGLKELFPSLQYVRTKCKEGYASQTSKKYRSYVDFDEWSKEDSE